MLSKMKNETTKLVKKVDSVLQNPTVQKVERVVMKCMPAIMLVFVCALVYSNTIVLADAKTLMTKVLQIMGAICTVMSVGIGGMGLMHFATAQADGDGPAKQKAIQQISASVILVVVGTLLLGGGADFLLNEINIDSVVNGSNGEK